MRTNWTELTKADQDVFRTTIAFLNDRLSERETVEWALRLTPRDEARRLAITTLLRGGVNLREPWSLAWRLIEESWQSDAGDADRNSLSQYDITKRIKLGDRSGSLVDAIVALVRPRLKVAKFDRLDHKFATGGKHPKTARDLMKFSLTSGDVVDPIELGISLIAEAPFLYELAVALDACVTKGIAIAERLYGPIGPSYWTLGDLRRVYFVQSNEVASGQHEPDQFHRGIAPSVKLLHAVVNRLLALQLESGLPFVRRWRDGVTPIHIRLWCAIACDPRFVLAQDVAKYLFEADNDQFWRLESFPEVAELRAKRFSSLPAEAQEVIARRLRKGPPLTLWPKKTEPTRRAAAIEYMVIREFRRIQVAGGSLPSNESSWLVSEGAKHPNLVAMSRWDADFLGTSKAFWVAPNPDEKYNALTGVERLHALEHALSTKSQTWERDPATRASDWLRGRLNVLAVVGDLESAGNSGEDYPHVWEAIAWAHASVPQRDPKDDGLSREFIAESIERILALLLKLPDSTAFHAIEGIAHWLDTWAKDFGLTPISKTVWLRFWPLAVKSTNSQQKTNEAVSLSVVARVEQSDEPQDLDTLNTPAGRLAGVFLELCPNLTDTKRPFEDDGLREMRHELVSGNDRSTLIARHRLIEHIDYFLQADRQWTLTHLVPPLREKTPEALMLWRAFARKPRSAEILSVIGESLVERILDPGMGRETRKFLIFNLVINSLFALLDNNRPSVELSKLTQTLRLLDDEARASAADAVRQFVSDLSREGKLSAEKLFDRAALPFLQTVWPQEQMLTTAGVAKAFAKLPIASGNSFCQAVSAITRFLVPFDSWSLIEYGLYGEDENGTPLLSRINDGEKARALLEVLDLTISQQESAAVPSDLTSALDQISNVAPKLQDTQAYRRLATIARR